MSLYVTEDCINCGACDATCPTGAIRENREKATREIDPNRCTECVGFYERTMCQVECPVECCLPVPGRRESEADLLERAKALFPDHAFPYPPPSHLVK